MKKLIHYRWCNSQVMGVFGSVYYNDQFICNFVEQPWRDNRPYKSCIPAGLYKLIEYMPKSERLRRYGLTFAYLNQNKNVFVEKHDRQCNIQRFACILHPANTADELRGCTAYGERLGVIGDKWAIKNSRIATDKIKALIRDEGITHIDIQWRIQE